MIPENIIKLLWGITFFDLGVYCSLLINEVLIGILLICSGILFILGVVLDSLETFEEDEKRTGRERK